MQTNAQKTERQFLHPEGAVQLHHAFPTIQGEGPFAGTPAIFVRLAGCNLQCPFCDTDYTSQRTTYLPWEILAQIQAWKLVHPRSRQLVVITGGEPFRQNLAPLCRALLQADYIVQIETNGTLYQGDNFPPLVTIVCSPKTGKLNEKLAKRVDAFKYVVEAGKVGSDGLPLSALGNGIEVAKPPAGSVAEIYIQPLDEQDSEKNRANTEAAVASCLMFGHRLCIQTHKLVNLE